MIILDRVPSPELSKLNWTTVIKTDLNHTFPIESEYADLIHAGQVIEHLSYTDIFIKEIKRVLKPGGYAVISTPNLASWHNVLWLMRGKQPMTCMVSDEMGCSPLEQNMSYPQHRRIFTFEGLTNLLEYHGLKVEAVKGAGYYPLPKLCQQVISKLDKKHSAYIVVKARKIN
jgi:SAM-dependent methyltransferase